MKLELKHIKPYEKLKVAVNQKYKGHYVGYITDIDLTQGTVKIKGIGRHSMIWKYVPLSVVTLFLHPLSGLTKEIEHNGEKFVPENILCHGDFDIQLLSQLDDRFEMWPHKWMQKLFEWHFDVYGLIEAGLAIDINTLKEKV